MKDWRRKCTDRFEIATSGNNITLESGTCMGFVFKPRAHAKYSSRNRLSTGASGISRSSKRCTIATSANVPTRASSSAILKLGSVDGSAVKGDAK